MANITNESVVSRRVECCWRMNEWQTEYNWMDEAQRPDERSLFADYIAIMHWCYDCLLSLVAVSRIKFKLSCISNSKQNISLKFKLLIESCIEIILSIKKYYVRGKSWNKVAELILGNFLVRSRTSVLWFWLHWLRLNYGIMIQTS